MDTHSNWATHLAEWWRNRRRGMRSGAILSDDTGMTVTVNFSDGSVEQLRLQWTDVNGVVAYKRDLFAYDEICLGFSSPDGGVEVNEQMQGWNTLIEALPAYLAGVPSPDQWWEKVAQPTFATNFTTLFPR